MLEAALAGAIAGYAIAIPVGAIAVLILHLAISQGFRAAAAAGLGTATADLIYASAAMIVGSAASALIATYQTPLRAVAAVFLIVLAIRGFVVLRSAHDPNATQTRDARHTRRRIYLTFLGLTLLNPVTITYFAALVVGLPNLGGAPERAAFAVAAFAASASWQVLLAGIGSLLGRGSNHRMRFITGVIGNLIVLGFGLVIGAQALGIGAAG
jgi:threonine/homoserine/homoserine lactone efflux protein